MAIRRSPWRTATASRMPIGQPRSCASADQRASSPQPVRIGGNGSSGFESARVKADHGAALHERGLAGDATPPAARHLPGGVRASAMRWLGDPQLEALGQEHERIEETAGQRHVVVDHEQPVVAAGGMLAPAGRRCSPTCRCPPATVRASVDARGAFAGARRMPGPVRSAGLHARCRVPARAAAARRLPRVAGARCGRRAALRASSHASRAKARRLGRMPETSPLAPER